MSLDAIIGQVNGAEAQRIAREALRLDDLLTPSRPAMYTTASLAELEDAIAASYLLAADLRIGLGAALDLNAHLRNAHTFRKDRQDRLRERAATDAQAAPAPAPAPTPRKKYPK